MSVLQLRQAIPIHWRTQLYNAPLPLLHDQPQFTHTPSSQAIALTKLKSRQIYWALINIQTNSANTVPKFIMKWNALYNLVAFDWDKIFCLHITFAEVRVAVFSVQNTAYNYRIITCNHWLFNTKIKGNPNCETCNCNDILNIYLYHVMN